MKGGRPRAPPVNVSSARPHLRRCEDLSLQERVAQPLLRERRLCRRARLALFFKRAPQPGGLVRGGAAGGSGARAGRRAEALFSGGRVVCRAAGVSAEIAGRACCCAGAGRAWLPDLSCARRCGAAPQLTENMAAGVGQAAAGRVCGAGRAATARRSHWALLAPPHRGGSKPVRRLRCPGVACAWWTPPRRWRQAGRGSPGRVAAARSQAGSRGTVGVIYGCYALPVSAWGWRQAPRSAQVPDGAATANLHAPASRSPKKGLYGPRTIPQLQVALQVQHTMSPSFRKAAAG